MVNDLVTVTEIARACNADGQRVRSLMRRLGYQPAARAGIVRLFPQSTIALVRADLKKAPAPKFLVGSGVPAAR